MRASMEYNYFGNNLADATTQDQKMHAFIQSSQFISQTHAPPQIPIATFDIFRGSRQEGQEYDVPTTQTLSNGVSLYYTQLEYFFPQRFVAPRPLSIPRNNAEENTHSYYNAPGLGPLDELPCSPHIIFSHGHGRGIRQPGFIHFCCGLARKHAVLAFRKDRHGEEKDSLEDRTAAFNYFYNDAYETAKALGGRSFGGRCALRASVYSGNRNLILWSYPLVRGEDVREQELLALGEEKRVLFIRGTNDKMSPEQIFNRLRKQMKAKTWCITVQDMDHGFKCDSAQEEKICNALGVIAGCWLEGDVSDPENPVSWDPEQGTEMAMYYDEVENRAVWSEWRPIRKERPEEKLVAGLTAVIAVLLAIFLFKSIYGGSPDTGNKFQSSSVG